MSSHVFKFNLSKPEVANSSQSKIWHMYALSRCPYGRDGKCLNSKLKTCYSNNEHFHHHLCQLHSPVVIIGRIGRNLITIRQCSCFMKLYDLLVSFECMIVWLLIMWATSGIIYFIDFGRIRWFVSLYISKAFEVDLTFRWLPISDCPTKGISVLWTYFFHLIEKITVRCCSDVILYIWNVPSKWYEYKHVGSNGS